MLIPSPGAGVPGNQVSKLPEDVAADLHHVLVTGWGLERLEAGTGMSDALAPVTQLSGRG